MPAVPCVAGGDDDGDEVGLAFLLLLFVVVFLDFGFINSIFLRTCIRVRGSQEVCIRSDLSWRVVLVTISVPTLVSDSESLSRLAL